MANETEGTVNVTVQSANKPKEAVRFYGTHHAKVATGTNQVTLPKAIKKYVEDGDEGHLMLVPRDADEVLYWQLYTKKALNQLIEDTRNNPELKENNVGRTLAQDLSSSAIQIEYDNQGRFVLNRDFAAKLGAEKNEVVFESAYTHLRLWAESDFEAEQEKIKKSKQSDVMKAARKRLLED